MAFVEGCKHSIEITVPVEEVTKETEKVVEGIRKKAHLPGFRPGKAPTSIIKSRFASDIRQQVVENLLPRFFKQEVEKDQLQVVGQPNVTDIHFHEGEPMKFTAEFEVAPEITLKEYKGVRVVYDEPVVTDEDIDKRIENIRIQKADYVNLDARPVENGDFAVISLTSVSGVEGDPIKQDELQVHVGDESTMPAFNENLVGMTPGESKEFEVTYPAEYTQERLAGNTVRFLAELKQIRKRELPELTDEFAQDLGDFKNMDEVREALRKTIFREREIVAQQIAKNQIVEKIVDTHEFPVPEAFVDRQIEGKISDELTSRGVDPRTVRIDWEKAKSAHKDQAVKEVKASMLLDKIAEAESVQVMQDEVDKEVQRIARQEREPVAATRMRLEKDGTLRRIALRIRTDKTLNLLFEHAVKEAGSAASE